MPPSSCYQPGSSDATGPVTLDNSSRGLFCSNRAVPCLVFASSTCFLTGAAMWSRMGVPPSPDDEATLSDVHPQMTRPPGCPFGPRLPLRKWIRGRRVGKGSHPLYRKGPQPFRTPVVRQGNTKGGMTPFGSAPLLVPGTWCSGVTRGSTTASVPEVAFRGGLGIAGRRGASPSLQLGSYPFCPSVTGNAMVQGGLSPCISRPSVPGAN